MHVDFVSEKEVKGLVGLAILEQLILSPKVSFGKEHIYGPYH